MDGARVRSQRKPSENFKNKGSGDVFLGANNLTVGSNNLGTTFSGVIQDGGLGGGAGGSLTKIGTGTLTLNGANTYTGGTVVTSGALGGTGSIAADVAVGTGSGPGATLSPGDSGPGTFTVHGTLTFNADATYKFELNSSTATADQVIAAGVTINSGALFDFADLGSASLTPGTVFTVIDNTAATPIAGAFSNLGDGSTFTVNGNTFEADYQGGDGNDLTLTVL